MNQRLENGRISLLVFVLASFVGIENGNGQPITVGANLTITLTTGIAGGTMTPVVNAARTLTYRRQVAISKITVSTSCPGQSFTLKVLATGVPDGNAAPEVDLLNGMPATDFIVNIPARPPTTARTCNLRYTASATFAQGNTTEDGNDVHTVTYTILAQ